jgi:N-methylhydantoinase B
MRQLDHHLAIDDGGMIVCRGCGYVFTAADRNFKEGAIRKDRPIQAANRLIVDPAIFIDDEVVFRQYICPGCATLLENEVILAESEQAWDKQLAAEGSAAAEGA